MYLFFYLGVPARRRKPQTHMQSNAAAPSGFSLQWLSSQPFPLQSLTHARRTTHPFRGEHRTSSSQHSPAPRFFPRTVHPRGCSARPSRFNPWLPRPAALQGCIRKTSCYLLSLPECTPRGTISVTPHRATERSDGVGDDGALMLPLAARKRRSTRHLTRSLRNECRWIKRFMTRPRNAGFVPSCI